MEKILFFVLELYLGRLGNIIMETACAAKTFLKFYAFCFLGSKFYSIFVRVFPDFLSGQRREHSWETIFTKSTI